MTQVHQATAKHVALAGYGLPEPKYLALCGLEQAAQHAQQTGFARAVCASDPKQLAWLHADGQAAEQLAAASGAGQAIQLEALTHGLAHKN